VEPVQRIGTDVLIVAGPVASPVAGPVAGPAERM